MTIPKPTLVNPFPIMEINSPENISNLKGAKILPRP